MNRFKSIKFLALAAAMFCPFFVACDDDDKNDVFDAKDYVVGTYSGNCKTTVYTAELNEELAFSITAQEDGTFTLVTPDITYSQRGETIPSLTISGLKAEQMVINNVVAFSLSANDYAGEVEVNGEIKNFTIKELSAAVRDDDKSAAINYTFNYGRIPFDVVVAFTGTKKN